MLTLSAVADDSDPLMSSALKVPGLSGRLAPDDRLIIRPLDPCVLQQAQV